MLVPEIQEYIKQQKAAGVSDTQIRQNLVTQGWAEVDLDQAFGITPVNPVVPQAPQVSEKSNIGKIIAIVVIVFILLPLLFFGAIAGYSYYKYKRGNITGCCDEGGKPQVTPEIKDKPTILNGHEIVMTSNLA